ncbi:MAG: Ig-like domain-containing protein [Desulfomicrobium apsheronum]|nr:Ig-like domain-containing protein [Desulfomicrobium apsheronum]
MTTASGNVLANDATGLTIVAVNGLSANVGVAVPGYNGGTFLIAVDGSWTFDPSGDFDDLPAWSSATTSAVYHAFDGVSEAPGVLTVTVEAYNPPPVAVADSDTTSAIKTAEGNVLTNDTDGNGDPLAVTAVNGLAANVGATISGSSGGLFTIASTGAWSFDPNEGFAEITAVTDTWVDYTISDGHSTSTARLTVSVTPSAAAIELVGTATGHAKNTNYTINLPAGVLPGDLVLVATGCHSSGNLNPGVVSPSGYTELADLFADDSSDANLSINYKIMSDPVDASVTVSGSASAELGAATAVYVFRGVNQLEPLDVPIQTAVGANSAYADCPSITPVTDGALVVIFGSWTYQAATADTTAKASEGWENFIAINSATYYFAIQGCTKFWETGDGAVDPAAWTGQGTSTSRSWAAASLALKPS